MKSIAALTASLSITMCPQPANSGCRHVVVHKQAAVLFAPSYPAYYYQVGMPLQLLAIKEQLKAELRAEQLAAQPQQLTAPQCPDGTCPTPQPQTLPLTTATDRWALTKQFCAGCHTTKAAAMDGLNMSDFSALTCEQRLAAVRMMIDGHMPPDGAKQPTAEQLGNLIGEWVNAETVGK